MKNPTDLELAALVQADQLRKAGVRSAALRAKVNSVREARAGVGGHLDALDAEVGAMRATLGLDDIARPDAGQALTRFDPTPREMAVIEASLPTFAPLRTLPLDEGVFRSVLLRYATEEEVDLGDDPISLLLPLEQVRATRLQWERSHPRLSWDRWDYALVGGAAVLGAVLDFVLVGVPQDMVWKGVSYTGSPLTKLLREKSKAFTDGAGWLHRAQTALEKWAKVPFDIARNDPKGGTKVDGLRPAMHRLMSPGHDPVLGFVFGVLDLLRGTCTLIDPTGVVHVLENGDRVSIGMAVPKLVAHLLSDIPTSAGLPSPFFSALQLIQQATPVAVGPSGKALSTADLSRWMYGQGYDARHFATMGIVPLAIESLVRVGFWARNRERFVPGEEAPPNVALKRAEMLALTHAVSASTNALKVALFQGNPLAINQAVWMALAGTTIQWLRAKREHEVSVQEELLRGWHAMVTA